MRPTPVLTQAKVLTTLSHSIYEWEKNLRINRFANGSPAGVPITTLRFVNEDDIGLLLTASGSSLLDSSSSPKLISTPSRSRWTRSSVPSLRVTK